MGAGALYGHSRAKRMARAQATQANRHFKRNIAEQRDFAHNSIAWRAADARRAGLHPLAALQGGSSFSPVSAPFVSSRGGSSSGELIGEHLGQALTRSANATRTAQEQELGTLNLENARLRNDRLRVEIQAAKQQMTPGLVDYQAIVNNPTRPGSTNIEPGQNPDLAFMATSRGLAPVASKMAKERTEDTWFPAASWVVNNVGGSYFSSNPSYRPTLAQMRKAHGHRSKRPITGMKFDRFTNVWVPTYTRQAPLNYRRSKSFSDYVYKRLYNLKNSVRYN